MKGKMFAEYRLVFQEKGKSPGRIERVGENREAEVQVEQYCHTEAEIEEAYKKIDAVIKSLKGYDKITVVLKGIASNKPFDSFYNTEKKKMCIDLNRTPQFKGDFDYALKMLFLCGSFDAILGPELAKQLENSMQKNAIEGIWDLPIEAQQNIMKYAQAYLLVESMGTGLSKKFAGRKNITFRMEIEKDMTEGSKSRTSINLEPKKKGAEVLSREEPRKKPEPILKPISEQREVIKPVEYKETVGLLKEEEARLAGYADFYSQQVEKHRNDENLFNRTFPHRLEDHEFAMEALMNPDREHRDIKKVMPGLDRERSALHDLHSLLFPTDQYRPFFIDIGPGIANADTIVMDGKGTPAITSIEMAERFPDMPVAVLDLPESVDIFLGKKEGKDRYGRKYKINEAKRDKLMRHSNIHIVSGNGLESLKDQWEDPDTNPEKYRLRKRPQIDKNTTLFIRTANAIDIYCDWDTENYGAPNVRNALLRMAKDFRENPVMLFFNKEILFKPQNSTNWTIIGQLSNRGFEHNNRKPSRKGQPPFQFDEETIKRLMGN